MQQCIEAEMTTENNKIKSIDWKSKI